MKFYEKMIKPEGYTENKIVEHIIEYENAIPEELCDKLIQLYADTTDAIKGQALLRDIVEEIEIPCGSGELDDATEELWEQGKVDEEIADRTRYFLNKYLSNYMCYPYEYRYTGTKFLRYPHNSHSPIHYDDELMTKNGSEIGRARPITIVIYLNEGFQGGETYFPDQGALVTPKKGKLVIFPASYMYPHSTIPSSGDIERFALLPFYVKAGLNVKLENSFAKKESFKEGGKELRKLLKG